MRKVLSVLICLSILLVFVGCSADHSNIGLTSGFYYIVGDYEEFMTPYLKLYLDENTFYLGMGTILSYAERGSFTIENGKLIGKSQNTTFIFEITDSNTLVLVQNELFDELPENACFVFAADEDIP